MKAPRPKSVDARTKARRLAGELARAMLARHEDLEPGAVLVVDPREPRGRDLCAALFVQRRGLSQEQSLAEIRKEIEKGQSSGHPPLCAVWMPADVVLALVREIAVNADEEVARGSQCLGQPPEHETWRLVGL